MPQADDGVHGGPDVVAHIGQKLALGPVGLLRNLPGFVEFPLHPYPLGNVMDDGKKERSLIGHEGRGMNFDGANGPVSQTVGEDEIIDGVLLRQFLLSGNRFLGEQIDLLDVHPPELVPGVTVELGGGRIGVHDTPGERVDEEHHGAVRFVHPTKTLFTGREGISQPFLVGNVPGDPPIARQFPFRSEERDPVDLQVHQPAVTVATGTFNIGKRLFPG